MFPHGWHLLLCLLTCGCWLPIYFVSLVLAILTRR